MQRQPNTFAAPAVQILHFLYFYIGLLGFFVDDGMHPPLLLIGYLSFFSVSAFLIGRVLYAGWCSGARIAATIQSVGSKSLYYVSLFCTSTLTELMQALTGVSSAINQVKGWVTLTKPL